jgi:hypothetical protein
MPATRAQVDRTLVALLLLLTLVAVAGAACGRMRAAVIRPPSAFDGVAVARPAWVYCRRSLGHATADLVAHDGAEKGDLAPVKALRRSLAAMFRSRDTVAADADHRMSRLSTRMIPGDISKRLPP